MVLYLSDEMDLDLRLPEVYTLLGEKLTMTFLEVFGGRTIDVPSVAKVREAFRAVSAYMRVEELRRVNSDDDAVAQAAAELDMTPDRVVGDCGRVKAMLERLGRAILDVRED